MSTSKTTEFHRSLTSAFESSMRKPMSRRTMMRTSAAVAAGGAMALTMSGPALLGFQSAMAQDFTGPVDVLNYALTLEHLEATFYRENNKIYSAANFGQAGFATAARERLNSIEAHEAEHVKVLTQVITSLGGTPVAEAKYNFGVTDVKSYVATARVLENLGTGAYTGAAQFLIGEDDLLTAALTIHGVEARHASYLNFLNGEVPFPDAFEAAIAPADVLKAATPLIVATPMPSMPNTGSGSTRRASGPDGSSLLIAAAGVASIGVAALAAYSRTDSTTDEI